MREIQGRLYRITSGEQVYVELSNVIMKEN